MCNIMELYFVGGGFVPSAHPMTVEDEVGVEFAAVAFFLRN